MLYTGIVKGAPKWRPIVVAALFLIFTGLNIFGEYRSSDPHYQHIIFGALALFLSATFAFILTRWVHLGTLPDARQLGWALANAMIAAYAFGTWLGY
jgi:hypothetical protein